MMRPMSTNAKGLQQIKTAINDAVNIILSSKQKKVIKMYYAGYNIKTISIIMGVDISVISRIHKKALEKIKRYLMLKNFYVF